MSYGQWIPIVLGGAVLVSFAYWFVAMLWATWATRRLRRAMSKHDYAGVLRICRSTSHIVPQNCAWRVAQAEALLHLAHYDEALEAAERALKRKPGYVRGLLVKSIALLWLSRPHEAEIVARQALARASSSLWTWSNLGTVLFAQYRMQLAAEAYAKAVALIPSSATTPPQFLSNYSVALSRLGRFDEALTVSQRAMTGHPVAGALFAQAFALVGLDRLDEATSLLQPNVGASHAVQSLSIECAIAYRRHDNAEALDCAQRKTDQSPGDARPWARLALAEIRMGNLANAERALDTGERLGQDDYLLLAAKAALHLASGRASEALRTATTAAEIAPLDLDVRAIQASAQQALAISRDRLNS